MKIYLCGQKTFGAETLLMLRHLGHEIVGVSAPRESRDGRTDRLCFAASKFALPLLPAGELNAATLPEGVDLIVCAHSHDFVGKATLQKARLGGIGYHPSLLPLHRGRDAIRWTIKMGERVTGGTVYWLSDGVDAGPIAAQEWCFVRPDDSAQSLWTRELLPLGLRLFERTLSDIGKGVLVKIPQDEALATWEPSFNPPPLRRPDLPMLGSGKEDGFRIITTRTL